VTFTRRRPSRKSPTRLDRGPVKAGNAFNLLNANPEETTSWISGPSFLRPLNIVAPRIVRIGTKLEW
jgi:hypothetical protein